MSQQFGARPEDETKPPSYPVIHCPYCGTALLWCWDDMYPEDEDPLFRRQVNFDPVSAERGDVVLWYVIDGHGKPISRQFFKRMAEVDPMYSGDAWRFHSATCTRKGGRR
jgi:hypothetical protein